MNIQTVSQRFGSVQSFVREIFEEMFHSNLYGYVWRRHACVRLMGTNMAAGS